MTRNQRRRAVRANRRRNRENAHFDAWRERIDLRVIREGWNTRNLQ